MTAAQDKYVRHRKMALIPFLTLVLCISCMFTVAYSVAVSDVTNDANIIAAEGIDAKIIDDSGDILTEEQFSRNANDGTGASRLGYGSTSINNEDVRYRIGTQTLELGQAKLLTSATKDSSVKFVKISYTITWNGTSPESEYGMTTSLIIGTGINQQIISEGKVTDPINMSMNSENEITLIGHIDEEIVVDIEPGLMTYSITIYIEPT